MHKTKEKPVAIKKNPTSNTSFLYSWGFSKYGQTALDNCLYTLDPNLVNQKDDKEITDVFSGEFNSAFLTKNNSLYLFGKNSFGQLGEPNLKNTYSSIPIKLSIKCEKVALGGEHVLILTSENNLYSFGLNIFGQLGLGHTENINTPTLVDKFGIFKGKNTETFTRNSTDHRILDISCGAQHSLILSSRNTLYSCGFSQNGCLGYYSNNNKNNSDNGSDSNECSIFMKVPLETNSKERITKICCGVEHSCCCGNSEFYIWGKTGELISDEGFNKFKISDIVGPNNSDGIKDIQLGNNFCILLTKKGDLYSCGNNTFGQLGRNEKEKTDSKFQKINFGTFKIFDYINVGYNTAFAITAEKKIYAWGKNDYGQIFESDKEKNYSPIELSSFGNSKVIKIAPGGYHVSILTKEKIGKIFTSSHFNQISLNSSFNASKYSEEQKISNEYINKIQSISTLQKEIESKKAEIEKLRLEIEKEEEDVKDEEEDAKNNANNELGLEEIENSLNEEILLEELEIPEKNQVDIGSYGEVKIAYWRKTKVAVKFLKVGMAGENDITISFIEEFNLLKKLRHPNILLVLGGNITKGNELFMVTEFCEKGNLFDYLHNTSKSVIPIKQKLTMALGICKGMNYLHSFRPPILHRDLKSLNILVDKFNEVKITDFGWARLKSEYMTRERGTFQWMSPEIISGSSYTEKADVYSFGIILWEFWSVEPPYYQIPAKEVAENVRNNKEYRPPISDEVPEEISSLIKACWDYDPEARPTFEEIVIYLKKILGED